MYDDILDPKESRSMRIYYDLRNLGYISIWSCPVSILSIAYPETNDDCYPLIWYTENKDIVFKFDKSWKPGKVYSGPVGTPGTKGWGITKLDVQSLQQMMVQIKYAKKESQLAADILITLVFSLGTYGAGADVMPAVRAKTLFAAEELFYLYSSFT